MDSTSPSGTFQFLELPVEMRSIVYGEFLLPPPCSTNKDEKYLPDILSVSRQLYHEVMGQARITPTVVDIEVGGGITYSGDACYFYWYTIKCGDCGMRFEWVDDGTDETEFERKVQRGMVTESVDSLLLVPPTTTSDPWLLSMFL